MLLRRGQSGVLAIGQASHAWLSGQLARAWGNEQFGEVEPWDEVCLAAEQHDIGWIEHDLEPLYDAEHRLPRGFMDMPLEVHLAIWTQGPRRLQSQSHYAALLASLHGWRLYERRDLSHSPGGEAEAIRAFLGQQAAFQQELMGTLGADAAQVERNSLLIWTWDYLSLALCLDWAPATAKRAPTSDGSVDLRLLPGGGGSFSLDPWPFQADSVRVRCEGRRLPERFENESAMRRGFAEGPIETLEFTLARRACSPASPVQGE